MFNSFNFINKSQKEFFKNYGYIVLQNQLTYKIKKNLKSYVQDLNLYINLNMIHIIKKNYVELKI